MRKNGSSSTLVGFLAAPVFPSFLLLAARLVTKFLVHAFQVTIQRSHRFLYCDNVLLQTRRLLAFLIHAEDLVYAFNIERIPRVLFAVPDPQDLSENVCLLQACGTLFCQERAYHPGYVFQRLQVGFKLVVETTFQPATLT